MTLLNESSFVLDKTRIALYFNKFKYRARLKISKVNFFRGIKKHHEISQRLERIRNRLDFRLSLYDYEITLDIVRLISWLESHEDQSSEFMIRYYNDSVDFYSNNITLIQSLLIDVPVDEYKLFYSKMISDYKHGHLYLKNPQSKYRAYFRWISTTADIREDLTEFVTTYNLKPSNSFTQWLEHKSLTTYLWDNYFFDFDDEMLITLLSLKYDNIIRRVYKIEKR